LRRFRNAVLGLPENTDHIYSDKQLKDLAKSISYRNSPSLDDLKRMAEEFSYLAAFLKAGTGELSITGREKLIKTKLLHAAEGLSAELSGDDPNLVAEFCVSDKGAEGLDIDPILSELNRLIDWSRTRLSYLDQIKVQGRRSDSDLKLTLIDLASMLAEHFNDALEVSRNVSEGDEIGSLTGVVRVLLEPVVGSHAPIDHAIRQYVDGWNSAKRVAHAKFLKGELDGESPSDKT